MIDTIYIEEEAQNHTKTLEILKRFPKARKINVERYTEVFNSNAQNFRLQKQNPSLVLAVKHKGFVLPAPKNYGIGGDNNFYFSYMMNCVYDCRYCFIQGMYNSANYVVFVNYEDYFCAITEKQKELEAKPGWFFSGYDCDSLALEPATYFIDAALDHFQNQQNSWLELRTKSTQIRPLLKRDALPNCVVAFSMSPEGVVQILEHKTPSLEKRIQAAKTLSERGWPIGFRFDPIIEVENFNLHYEKMFQAVFSEIPESSLHSVSLGPFRLPKAFHKKLSKLYPEEALLASGIEMRNNIYSYRQESEQKMLQFCEEKILQYIPSHKYFPCVEVKDSVLI